MRKKGEELSFTITGEDAEAQEGQPEEIFFGERFELPGGKGAGEDDDGREQQHGDADAIDSDRVFDVERFKPREGGCVEEFSGLSCCAVAEEDDGEIGCQDEQGTASGHHDGAHSLDVTCQPKTEQHDKGDEYE